MKQVVIEIDDELYANIDEPTNDEDLLRYIIKRGILLPEDHGDLIDFNDIEKVCSQYRLISLYGAPRCIVSNLGYAIETKPLKEFLPVIIPGEKKGDSCTDDTD